MENLVQLFVEFLVFLMLAGIVLLFARYKKPNVSKIKSEILPESRKQNLANLAEIFNLKFDENICDFREFLDDLIAQNGGRIFKFSKNISQIQFIKTLGEQNFNDKFLERNFTLECISQEFLSHCANNLNESLAIGLYLQEREFYAFLCENDELLLVIDIAINLNESIVICD